MRRIHYIPGLLSLALMLPLGLWYFQSHRAFREERCIQMVFPILDPSAFATDDLRWHPQIPNRKWAKLQCNGTIQECASKLAEFDSLISAFPKGTDTINGISLELGPSTKYETAIHAIELCRRDSMDTYWLGDKKLLVFNYPPPPPDTAEFDGPVFFCGTGDFQFERDVISTPVTWWDGFRNLHLATAWEAAITIWPALPLFVWLLVRSLYRTSHLRRKRYSRSSPE
jgi:hypothetical protein